MALECVANILCTHLEKGGYTISGSRVREKDADIKIRFSATSTPVDETWLEQLKSLEYSLPIGCIAVRGNTINVNVTRSETFVKILKNASSEIDQSIDRKFLSVDYNVNSSEEDLTDYRVLILAQTIDNLCAAVDENTRSNASDRRVYLSNKSNLGISLDSDQKLILCGSVLNAVRKKKETLKVSEVKRLKKEMLLEEIEQKDTMNEEAATLLADAILKYDLLSVKVSKPVYFNVLRSESGASGSVVFIMYNYSRLNAILHEYQSRVGRNYYSAPSAIEEIDFCNLKREDEWKLLRDFVMHFPTVIRRTLEDIGNGKPAPHLLCQFLYALARAVSSYYRRTKILLDGEPSLLKVSFARIQLVKAIHQILYRGLKLLNIEALPVM